MRKVCLLVLCCLVMCSFFNVASGKTIYVDDDGGKDYTNIQDAINAASDGDTVYVFSGVYDKFWDFPNDLKKLEISKKINLIGEDKNSTIIDGKGDYYAVISINADDVNISGFTLKNSDTDGIKLNGSNCKIEDNIISNNSNGIYFTYTGECNNNSINNNTLINNSWGIWISKGNDNEVNYNIIDKIKQTGILIEYYSNNNKIMNNTISNNLDKKTGWAIYIEGDSKNNLIEENHIEYTYYGIHINAPVISIISKNQINGCEEGIRIVTPNGTITENTLSNCNYGVRYVEEYEGTYTLDNNYYSNNNKNVDYIPVINIDVNDGKPSTPGFELILIFVAVALVLFWQRKRI